MSTATAALNNNFVRWSATNIAELRRIATALEAIARHYEPNFEPFRPAPQEVPADGQPPQ